MTSRKLKEGGVFRLLRTATKLAKKQKLDTNGQKTPDYEWPFI